MENQNNPNKYANVKIYRIVPMPAHEKKMKYIMDQLLRIYQILPELKKNHADDTYYHEDAEFNCFYIEDGELVGMGVFNLSAAYTIFLEKIERADDICTRAL